MTQLTGIRLETLRLSLSPLDADQLVLCLQQSGTFGHCTEELLFTTLWIMVKKKQKVPVGEIGFKGPPSEKGLVEIGYATYPEFRNQGYMTEALNCMVHWAFCQAHVQIILAETDKSNAASQRILNKNHFQPFAESDTMFWWRLDRYVE